ncbi:hypothetical protein PS15p_202585 [Mucor circinelloides]
MNSDTTTIPHLSNSHSAKSSLSSSLLGSNNSGSKRQNNTNIRKFFNRFPSPKSPPLSPHPDISKYHDDISRCPMMNSRNSSSIDEELSPTQKQIDLVRTSWERVSEIRHETDDRNVSASHAFGLAFYDALFEMDEDCRHLFDNVFQQARALTGMISYIARAPNVTNNNSTMTRPACCGGNGAGTYSSTGLDSPPSTPTTIKDINARKRAIGCDSNEETYDEGDPEWLALQMRELGARHYFYKVKPHHLELVGPAFAAALKKRLGNEYTTEIGDAWVKANSYAAYNMKIGFESQASWEEGTINNRSSRKNKAACTIQ